MLGAAGQGAYMARVGLTAAQLAPQKAEVARQNLELRKQQIQKQQQQLKQRRKPYEDVKGLSIGEGKTIGDLKLSNQQLKDIRKQYFGTTRSTSGKTGKK